eukprot:Sro411_g137540.1 n/a (600) ;mRNA; f:3493-5403
MMLPVRPSSLFSHRGVLLIILCILNDRSRALTASRNRHGDSRATTTSPPVTQLSLARRFRDDKGYEHEHDELSRQRSTDRPTLRKTQLIGPPIMPGKPKIVVLGASGRIGRLVVRQLLEMKHLDATIIACVKDYDKACRVLYDDMSLATRQNSKGPRLTIVEANLVEELPFYLEDEEEELEWRERAESAAQFYNTSVSKYDNREEVPIADSNEALQDAIQDCTTIISCVGSVRPTNLWTDHLARPLWRWLKPDVSGWCKDARHPYYVHFQSTRKILGYAEREQLRREAAVEMEEPVVVPKIRYIRVSDNCLCQPVWEMVPLLTNIFRSNVFRYHDMAERLLESSTLIDTVILRPGDLVDNERDVNTTHIQVDPSGDIPAPAIVGREDVASLAVASALFRSPRQKEAEKVDVSESDTGSTQTQQHDPFHCKLAVRWVGSDMHPYPAQGKKKDGFRTAQISLQKALAVIKKAEKKERRIELRRQRTMLSSSLVESYPETVVRLAQNFQTRRKKRQLKPYGIASAIPIYLMLALATRSLGRLLWTVLCTQTWAQPLVTLIQKVSAMLIAFLAPHLQILQQFLARHIPRGLRRAFGSKQYISF